MNIENLAWALNLRGVLGNDPQTKLVLIYLAAYDKLSLIYLAALTELSRDEVRWALEKLQKLGWYVDGELRLPPRFANTPSETPPKLRKK